MSRYTRPAEQITADTLLIVDDDAINRKVLGKIFSGCYQVEEAQDGAAGLKKLLDDPDSYCAVLLDVMMPGLSGIEVLRELKDQNLLD